MPSYFITILVVQGGIALGAFLLAGFFDPVTIIVLTALRRGARGAPVVAGVP